MFCFLQVAGKKPHLQLCNVTRLELQRMQALQLLPSFEFHSNTINLRFILFTHLFTLKILRNDSTRGHSFLSLILRKVLLYVDSSSYCRFRSLLTVNLFTITSINKSFNQLHLLIRAFDIKIYVLKSILIVIYLSEIINLSIQQNNKRMFRCPKSITFLFASSRLIGTNIMQRQSFNNYRCIYYLYSSNVIFLNLAD